MTTLDILPPQLTTAPTVRKGKLPLPERLDVSRGARLRGLPANSVLMEKNILRQYSELDPTLGQNVVGAILTALAAQQAVYPGGVPDETITVGLIRREDNCEVELDLRVVRACRSGAETIFLRKAAERRFMDVPD